MKIKFASDILKITFEENEPFGGRSLVISGEVINHGFSAIVSTMNWLSPGKREPLSANEKALVSKLIQDYNKGSKFFVDLDEK